MRRLLSVTMVALTTVLVPVFAMAGNQEVADNIAHTLKQSGHLSDYRIAVKFQDGTATIKGRIANQEQMNTVLKLVYKSPGVERVVNNLTIGESEVNATAGAKKSVSSAQRVASTFTQAPVRRVSVMEPSTLPEQRPANYAARPISGQMPLAMRTMNNQEGEVQGAPVQGGPIQGGPRPMYSAAAQAGAAPARYDQPCMPNYSWPSYAAYPNYAAVTYPRQYSPTAWPYIGPFYPYPQVPLGWRKVSLEWKDGWWFLDFKDEHASCWR
jgi:hypothetical protein